MQLATVTQCHSRKIEPLPVSSCSTVYQHTALSCLHLVLPTCLCLSVQISGVSGLFEYEEAVHLFKVSDTTGRTTGVCSILPPCMQSCSVSAVR